ncbi:unnamed protein product [Linum trigynum]|uniref:Uncharacterized protein n=1 Tax=Linum trigynum TaxID=586398 RepID=A0AAV2D7X0_9ROSI
MWNRRCRPNATVNEWSGSPSPLTVASLPVIAPSCHCFSSGPRPSDHAQIIQPAHVRVPCFFIALIPNSTSTMNLICNRTPWFLFHRRHPNDIYGSPRVCSRQLPIAYFLNSS